MRYIQNGEKLFVKLFYQLKIIQRSIVSYLKLQSNKIIDTKFYLNICLHSNKNSTIMLYLMMLSFPKSDKNNIVMAIIFMKINMIFISDTVMLWCSIYRKNWFQTNNSTFIISLGSVRAMVTALASTSAGAAPTDGPITFFVRGIPLVMHCSSSCCSEALTASSAQSPSPSPLSEPALSCLDSTVTASSTVPTSHTH